MHERCLDMMPYNDGICVSKFDVCSIFYYIITYFSVIVVFVLFIVYAVVRRADFNWNAAALVLCAVA